MPSGPFHTRFWLATISKPCGVTAQYPAIEDARGILRTEQRIALVKDVEVFAAGFNYRKPEKGPLLNRDVDNVPASFRSRQSPASGLLNRHLAWRSAYS